MSFIDAMVEINIDIAGLLGTIAAITRAKGGDIQAGWIEDCANLIKVSPVGNGIVNGKKVDIRRV